MNGSNFDIGSNDPCGRPLIISINLFTCQSSCLFSASSASIYFFLDFLIY